MNAPRMTRLALLTAILGMATVSAAVYALLADDQRIPLAVITLCVPTCAAVLMWHQHRTMRRLEVVAKKHRADASRWEWRIARAVGVVSGLPAATTMTTPVPAKTRETVSVSKIHAPDTDPKVQILLESGLLEWRFYAAMANVEVADEVEAAQHFLSTGMRKGLSPTPLLDIKHLPASVANHYKAGGLDILLRHLKGSRTGIGTLSDHFDARLLEVTGSATQEHPGGAIGWFVGTATDDTFLPTTNAALRWGPFRAAMLQAVSNTGTSRLLGRPRTSDSFDREASETWWTRVQQAIPPLDEPPGHPLVSVIMPTWDRAGIIATAIASVQQQTLASWELLIVDDGSTDSTAAVVEELAAQDDRILWLQGPHEGVSAARNRGVARARGEYLAFLDSDNTWTPEFLDRALRGMQFEQVDAAYAAIELHEAGSVKYRSFDGGLDALLVLNHIDMNILVVTRATALAVGEFDTSLRRWVDHDYAIRIAAVTSPKLLPFIGCIYDNDDDVDRPRITTRESDHWQWRVLGKHLANFDGATPVAHRVGGRVSIVIPTWNDFAMTIKAVDAVLAASTGRDVEVLVVDNGSDIRYSVELAARLTARRSTRYLRLPRNYNFAIGSNYGAVRSTGEYIVFLNNDTEVQPGWLDGLIQRLGDAEVAGVQPILRYPDDTIQAAGTVFIAPHALPVHFLASHPNEDASGVGEERFRAVTAAAVMLRASDVLQSRGFDTIFVNGMEDIDLCLRITAARGGYFAVEPSSLVYHMESKTPGRGTAIPENRRLFLSRWWSELTHLDLDKYARRRLAIATVGSDGVSPPAPRPVITRIRENSPRRWGIRHAAIGGPRGDRWGDTLYVESLASSLRAQGEEVVTFRHGANIETRCLHDDVNLVIRGLDRVHPVPGAVNILWILSHPEAISRDELFGFDQVFAASVPWARTASERFGMEVRPLLQATDTTRFRLPEMPVPGRPTTFVGSVHPGRRRKIVEDALMGNVPIRVIGTGWELPRDVHEADFVENDRLPAIYQASHRVLADHWKGMADEGFIQNRLFDAVACGARVITDPVLGLREVFGSAVQSYCNIEELHALCSTAADSLFGTADEIRAQARAVAQEHSFDRRAEELIRAVESLR